MARRAYAPSQSFSSEVELQTGRTAKERSQLTLPTGVVRKIDSTL